MTSSILLRDWESRAILEGRLSMLARPAKLTCSGHVKEPCGHRSWHPADPDCVEASRLGRPGDVLLGKEAWGPADVYGDESDVPCTVEILYRASNDVRPEGVGARAFGASEKRECSPAEWLALEEHIRREEYYGDRWKPAQHMPAWAVRIRLRVVGVECRRVRSLSVAEAFDLGYEDDAAGLVERGGGSRICLSEQWDADNPRFPWESDPWAWLARVERVQ